jgi:hypothetical protein
VAVAKSTLGFTHVVWQDDGAGSDDILAQNYLPNGSLGGAAQVATRNGAAVNPVVLTAPLGPALGQSWMAQVDRNGVPGSFGSILFVYGAPFSGLFLPQGELLVDPSSPLVLTSAGSDAFGYDPHSIPVPPVLAFLGIQLSTQSLILHPTFSQLTNALDITVGL